MARSKPTRRSYSPSASARAWQRLEGGGVLVASLVLIAASGTQLSFWLLLVLFLLPDVTMLGYWFGPRVGARLYNAAHIYSAGAILAALGLSQGNADLVALGALWLGHVGFDRLMGYGLKELKGFHFTHMGRIGRPRPAVTEAGDAAEASERG